MARQEINIGVSANDGNGDPLRTAFSKINSMTTELYDDDAADVNSITATAPIARDSATGAVTISLTDGGISTQKIADDAVTADKLASNAVTTAKILNDNVTHDKLENRYTAAVTISTLTGAYTLDWSTGAVFVMSGSLSGAIEFDFTNFKAGQTIDIYNLTGAQTITFDSNAGTSETFNKCGAVDYAGASTNLIQVQCVDDSATAVFNYAVSAYVSDATPS